MLFGKCCHPAWRDSRRGQALFLVQGTWPDGTRKGQIPTLGIRLGHAEGPSSLTLGCLAHMSAMSPQSKASP